jgi:mRNA interferase RelE/StbE
MAWQIRFSRTAEKQLDKLDPKVRAAILRFLHVRISVDPNPRSQGRALTGELQGLWRYRVGDYRILCEIRDSEVTILVLAAGHPRDIYR